VGKSLAVIPGTVPYDVAALNERMAVARHCVWAALRLPDGQFVVNSRRYLRPGSRTA
jgi:hypothetical protein